MFAGPENGGGDDGGGDGGGNEAQDPYSRAERLYQDIVKARTGAVAQYAQLRCPRSWVRTSGLSHQAHDVP